MLRLANSSKNSSAFFKLARTLTSTLKKTGLVTVRTWEPAGGSAGHASLATEKSYISLWPKDDMKKPNIKWLSFDGRFVETPEEHNSANGSIVLNSNNVPEVFPKKTRYHNYFYEP